MLSRLQNTSTTLDCELFVTFEHTFLTVMPPKTKFCVTNGNFSFVVEKIIFQSR